MIKLVLSDVDGTVTDGRRRISVKAVEAIRKAQDRGTVISLVSGNVIPVMYSLRTYIGLEAPVFAENGGSMIEDEMSVFFTMDSPSKFFEMITSSGLATGILTNKWRYCSMGYAPHEGKEQEIMGLASQENVEIANSGFSWHILNVGQNKAFARDYLMKRYRLKPEEVLVIGDNFNDIPMFRSSNKKAVPGNAEDELKEMADYVAERKFGEGTAEILSVLDSF